jgi:hypothetical protein
MRGLLVIAASLIALQSLQADIVYLKEGGVFAGKIVQMDLSVIRMELSNGNDRTFQLGEVFRATDNDGKVIFDSMLQPAQPELSQPVQMGIETDLETALPILDTPVEYKKVMRFPLWPFLGGTAILGYFGATQLNKSAETYDQSRDLEELGLEFNDTLDRSQKQRSWGQICIAGAVACLVTGLTPHFENIPVQKEVRILPSEDGITISYHF